MRAIKALMITILLSGFFVSSSALAKICDEEHRDYPGAKFHSIRIYTIGRVPTDTSCYYGEKGEYELLVNQARPRLSPVWENVGFLFWVCGKPYTAGTRETCVFD